MANLAIFTLMGLVGLVSACSGDEEDEGNGAPTGSATGTTTGAATGTATGTVVVPGAQVSNTGDTIVLDTGEQVAIVTDANGQQTGTLADGTIVYVLADGTVVTAAPADPDWDVYVPTDACVETSAGAEGAPAILQFVIDKSTSMNQTAPSTNGDSKWGATREALNSSYPTMDPTLAVGEFFYPNASGGCVEPTGGVSIDVLTAEHVQALIDGVNAIEDPTNPAGTPTHDAWREGLRRLQLALANPAPGYETAKGYIVLMTDGMPVRTLDCGRADGDNIAVTEEQFDEFITDVAQTTATTGIQTFVIGVPGSENDNQVPSDPSGNGVDYVPRTKLSEVAIAGQTAIAGCDPAGPNYCHIDMVEDPNFVEGLRAAISTITSSVVSCQYVVPAVPIPNVFVNPDDVVVFYYPGSGSAPIALTRSVDGCASGEWMYNDDQTMLLLCDPTCTTVKNDPGAEMEVYFGCIAPQ